MGQPYANIDITDMPACRKEGQPYANIDITHMPACRKEGELYEYLEEYFAWGDYIYITMISLSTMCGSKRKLLKILIESGEFDVLSAQELHFEDGNFEDPFMEDCGILRHKNGSLGLVWFSTHHESSHELLTRDLVLLKLDEQELARDTFARVAALVDKADQKDRLIETPEDLILPPRTKDEIFGDVQHFLDARDYYYDELNVPWRYGMLLWGKPGNGKTMTIRVLAKHFGLERVNLKDLVNGGRIEWRFDAVKKEKPKLVYIEDLDKMIPSKEAGIKDYAACSLNELLQFMDGVERLDGVILVATSNSMNDIVETITNRPGRIDGIHHIPNPGLGMIEQYAKRHSFKVIDKDDNDQTDEVIARLEGNSMAFVMRLVIDLKAAFLSNTVPFDAAMARVDRLLSHKHGGDEDSALERFAL